ncbi:MAG: hypothetical protein KJO91_13085, partial [Gammaproteobacteria bacterium]|nr:hypothetical protein [Gammaproteobacteria bacterium]
MIRDPKYLFSRIRQELVRRDYLKSAALPKQDHSDVGETALPGLIISGTPDQYENVIRHFRATFGSRALVYQKMEKCYLHPLSMDGSRGAPQVCADIDASVLFWPASANTYPPKDHLLSVYMAIISNGVNMALISHDLATGDTVNIGLFRDHLMFTRDIADSLFHDRLADIPFSGKILRIFPQYGSVEKQRLDELVGAPVSTDS